MAEFVENKIQELIPELEELERYQLLTPQEIKILIQKKRDFEYKAHRLRKEKQSILDYVLFDIKLLELISLRRKKNFLFKGVSLTDNVIKARIYKRLYYMTHYWPSHLDVWKLRISFSKSQKALVEVSSCYDDMSRFHANDLNMWISWAEFEVEGRNNFSIARSILLTKAPLHHPKSPALRREHFRLELLYIEHLKKKSKGSNIEGMEEVLLKNREKVLNCALPETIYKSVKNDFNSPQLFIELFFIAKKFPFAQQLARIIYKDLISEFGSYKGVWRMKGRLILEGIDPSLYLKEEEENDGKSDVVEPKFSSPKAKLTSLFGLYDEALVEVGTSFLEFYVQDLFHLLNEVWGTEEYFGIVSQKILEIFQQNADHLTEFQFLLWFSLGQHLNLCKEKIKKISDLGLKAYPSSPHIQVEAFSYSEDLLEEFQRKIPDLSGSVGALMCVKMIQSCKELAKRKKLLKLCYNHPDASIAKESRLYRLESFEGKKGLKSSRILYKKYSTLPPYFLAFHLTMIKKELSSTKQLSLSHLRKAFDLAIDYFGSEEPSLWLCYLEAERKFGSQKKVLHLKEKVDGKLNPKLSHEFIDQKFAIESSLNKKSQKDETYVFIDCPDKKDDDDDSKYEFWISTSLPPLFEEPLILMFSATKQKEAFFDSLVRIKKEMLGKISLRSEKAERSVYEEILRLIHGESVSLLIQKVKASTRVEEEVKEFLTGAQQKYEKYRKGQYSDRFQTVDSIEKSSGSSNHIQKVIESSETLKPGFLQQKQIIPYYIGKRTAKKMRKKEALKTSGKDWFNMKAPELTPEVKRDLELLKMRSVLNPKRHYKTDKEENPKFFQIGEVKESPADFYSSRIPVKQRKLTMVDEIIRDEDVMRYQKRKFQEIALKSVAKKQRLMAIKNSKLANKKKLQEKGGKRKRSNNF